ncbi:RHS repeat-associated core domain-containing protein [bacterium AH-315-C07]|nr:RHS repeat-associated core domain-containing protein [bacterium AH-315-C07]
MKSIQKNLVLIFLLLQTPSIYADILSDFFTDNFFFTDYYYYNPPPTASYKAKHIHDVGNPGGLNTESDWSRSGWTAISTDYKYNNEWTGVQGMPFPFKYFGERVYNFKVSQNGLITFTSPTTIIPDENDFLPSDQLPNKTIACFWDSFTDEPPTGGGDKIYTKVFGTFPNRQLWIKWYSMEYGWPNSRYNYFACVLEESTNKIYMVDMNYSANQNVVSTVGVQYNQDYAIQYNTDLMIFDWGGSSKNDNDIYEFTPYYEKPTSTYEMQYVADQGNPGSLNTNVDYSTYGWTALTSGSQSYNNWSSTASIPFEFDFFGEDVNSFMVSQNGLITFDIGTNVILDYNYNLPHSMLPEKTISCFWAPFTNTPPTGSNDIIYTRTFGTAPNRQLWIKWHSFEYGNPNSYYNYFACVLEESTNKIYMVDLNYRYNTNVKSTVGLQFNQENAVQYGNSQTIFGSGGYASSNNDYYEFTPKDHSMPQNLYAINYTADQGNPKGLNTEYDTYTAGWEAIYRPFNDDNSWSGIQEIPFNFKFYNEGVSQFKVSQNGLLTFETGTQILPNENEVIPTKSLPQKTISCFWDAFTVDHPTGYNDIIYTKLFGTAPNRQLWIKWFSQEMGDPAVTYNYFACVLEESSNNIYMVDMNLTSLGNISGTVGVQYHSAAGTQQGINNFFESGFYFNSDNDYYTFTPEINYAAACPVENTTKVALKVKLDLGEDYEFGKDISFNDTVIFSVNGYDAETGGTIVYTQTDTLQINQNIPEKIWYLESVPVNIKRVEANINSISSDNLTINDFIRVNAEIEKTTTYDVNKVPFNTEPMVTVNSVDGTTNPVIFTWEALCDQIPNYQVQILRLYNTEESLIGQQAIVDWSQALTIETESSETSLKLHLVEGTGYYIWRVRPIGNRYAGGIANNWNWGFWSETPEDGLIPVSFSGLAGNNSAFYYQQFDEDKNWIYSRIFSEENKIKETISFANGLQQVKQNQVKLQEYDQILANQTVYDFSGRPVINTMNAPLKNELNEDINSFSFISKLVKSGTTLYRDLHFDNDGNFQDPNMMEGLIADYYSNYNTEDLTIPNAEGYPYNRTLFYNDGTDKVKKQAGFGETFRLKDNPLNSIERVTKIYYSEVEKDELIKIFGNEAPNEKRVIKVITVDPNKTVSVKYINQGGKTIVTCLADAGPNNLLAALPSKEAALRTINFSLEIEEGANFVDNQLYTTKLLTLTERSTRVVLDYQINPNTIIETCTGFCTTCDYEIYFELYDHENDILIPLEDAILTSNLTVSPENCITGTASHTKSFIIVLAAGQYTISRKIVAENTNFETANKYLNEYAEYIEEYVAAQAYSELADVFSYLDAPEPDINALYSSLAIMPGDTEAVLNAGCFNITIPIDSCKGITCPADLDFEGILYEKWETKFGTHPYNYFYTNGRSTYPTSSSRFKIEELLPYFIPYIHFEIQIGSDVVINLNLPTTLTIKQLNDSIVKNINANPKYYAHLNTNGFILLIPLLENGGPASGEVIISTAGVVLNEVFTGTFPYGLNTVSYTFPGGAGAFNAMISHMVNEDGYDCVELMTCWKAIVEGLDALATTTEDTTVINKDFDLLRTFIQCVGHQYQDTAEQYYGINGYLEYAYKYIHYQKGSSPYCEANMDIDSMSTWVDSNWVQFLGCLESQDKDLVNYGLPEECDDPADPACLEELKNTIENNCDIGCMNRISSFYYQVKEEFEDADVYISNDCILDLAWDLVINCMDNCNLTIIPGEGVGTELEIELITQAMTHSFDIQLSMGGKCSPGYTIIGGGSATLPPYEDLAVVLNNALAAEASLVECLYYDVDDLFAMAHGFIPTSCVKDPLISYPEQVPVSCDHYSGWFRVSECRLLYEYYAPGSGANLNTIIICTNICKPQTTCPIICFKWEPINFDAPPDTLKLPSCEQITADFISALIVQQIDDYTLGIVSDFEDHYKNQCVTAANINELFEGHYSNGYYHYTLFYYDRAGNLVKTVPPAGVNELTDPQIAAGRYTTTDHTLATKYQYNSLQQLVYKNTPDGGQSEFWYDKKGQLRFSQSAQQKLDGKYTYSKYDYLGRVKETGETTEAISSFTINVDNPIFPSTGTERIFTVYTTPACGSCIDLTQRYLQNRVSFSYNDDNVKTYYSYDPHGNVEWMIQDIPGLHQKVIAYEYDLISNKVTKVNYNKDSADQFFHRYVYDSDNRIKQVQTSHDGIVWDTDASYAYYIHGPLKRLEIGEDHIQGLDYVYTLQGWLKGVNHSSLETEKDPGKDNGLGDHNNFAPDAFGMVLGYHNNDFKRDGSPFNNTTASLAGGPLYNGNITSWTTNTQLATAVRPGLTGHTFQYDELNRLLSSTFNHYSTSDISPWQELPDFATAYTYDPNGNIQTLDRNAYESNLDYDQLTYQYNPGTNQLNHLEDAISTPEAIYATDLESQSLNNYTYDLDGNLKSDVIEGIEEIDWNILGKVQSVSRSSSSNKPNLQFVYDATGNRIMKKVDNNTDSTFTYYVRDASGNIMGIYEKENTGDVIFTEAPIYGGDRIGIYKPYINENDTLLVTNKYSREIGKKVFEMKDHLGNVRVTISDIKNSDGSIAPANFTADILSMQNYYPFGSAMPGRTSNTTDYRYGFNGMEKDDELNGSGNSYDFGARIYDPRVGRWLSLDPLMDKYPDLSGYNFTSNNPVLFVDYDGKDYGIKVNHDNKTIVVVQNFYVSFDGSVLGWSEKQLIQGVKKWNNATGNYKGYKVAFDINVITVMNANVAALGASYDPIGNVYFGNDGKVDVETVVDGKKGLQGGITRKGSEITMHSTTDEGDIGDIIEAVVHEIGHTLGLGDKGSAGYSPNGTMKYRKKFKSPPIHIDDIVNVIDDANSRIPLFANQPQRNISPKAHLIEVIGKDQNNLFPGFDKKNLYYNKTKRKDISSNTLQTQ